MPLSSSALRNRSGVTGRSAKPARGAPHHSRRVGPPRNESVASKHRGSLSVSSSSSFHASKLTRESASPRTTTDLGTPASRSRGTRRAAGGTRKLGDVHRGESTHGTSPLSPAPHPPTPTRARKPPRAQRTKEPGDDEVRLPRLVLPVSSSASPASPTSLTLTTTPSGKLPGSELRPLHSQPPPPRRSRKLGARRPTKLLTPSPGSPLSLARDLPGSPSQPSPGHSAFDLLRRPSASAQPARPRVVARTLRPIKAIPTEAMPTVRQAFSPTSSSLQLCSPLPPVESSSQPSSSKERPAMDAPCSACTTPEFQATSPVVRDKDEALGPTDEHGVTQPCARSAAAETKDTAITENMNGPQLSLESPLAPDIPPMSRDVTSLAEPRASPSPLSDASSNDSLQAIFALMLADMNAAQPCAEEVHAWMLQWFEAYQQQQQQQQPQEENSVSPRDVCVNQDWDEVRPDTRTSFGQPVATESAGSPLTMTDWSLVASAVLSPVVSTHGSQSSQAFSRLRPSTLPPQQPQHARTPTHMRLAVSGRPPMHPGTAIGSPTSSTASATLRLGHPTSATGLRCVRSPMPVSVRSDGSTLGDAFPAVMPSASLSSLNTSLSEATTNAEGCPAGCGISTLFNPTSPANPYNMRKELHDQQFEYDAIAADLFVRMDQFLNHLGDKTKERGVASSRSSLCSSTRRSSATAATSSRQSSGSQRAPLRTNVRTTLPPRRHLHLYTIGAPFSPCSSATTGTAATSPGGDDAEEADEEEEDFTAAAAIRAVDAGAALSTVAAAGHPDGLTHDGSGPSHASTLTAGTPYGMEAAAMSPLHPHPAMPLASPPSPPRAQQSPPPPPPQQQQQQPQQPQQPRRAGGRTKRLSAGSVPSPSTAVVPSVVARSSSGSDFMHRTGSGLQAGRLGEVLPDRSHTSNSSSSCATTRSTTTTTTATSVSIRDSRVLSAPCAEA